MACGAEWHVGHFFCAECGDVCLNSLPSDSARKTTDNFSSYSLSIPKLPSSRKMASHGVSTATRAVPHHVVWAASSMSWTRLSSAQLAASGTSTASIVTSAAMVLVRRAGSSFVKASPSEQPRAASSVVRSNWLSVRDVKVSVLRRLECARILRHLLEGLRPQCF